MSDLKGQLQALPPLRELIAKYDLMARKSLGQHFLCDLNLTAKIAACAGDLSGLTVFEIGPGPGGLTRALLSTTTAKIIAIEKDRRCLDLLAGLTAIAGDRLRIIEGDAMTADLTALASTPRAIVANLPYNIGTELLLGWLRQIARSGLKAPAFDSLTLMFQAEVIDRITASPGSKAYGRLSVISQFICNPRRMMDIPAAAFTPPPKIDSAVVHLTPRLDRPDDISFDQIGKVTAAAFGQRRKMLRSSLKPLGGSVLLERAGIDPELRAENLTLQQFETLARLASN